MTYTFIASVVVPSNQTSIEFTSIPATFTDLLVVHSARMNTTGQGIQIQFNNVGTGYSRRNLIGDGSNVYSFAAGDGEAGVVGNSSYTANTFGNGQIYIPNYAGSTNKSWSAEAVNEHNATAAGQYLIAGLWSNTAAITSLKLFGFNGADNFVQYSRFYLYGIKSGSSGGVVVS